MTGSIPVMRWSDGSTLDRLTTEDAVRSAAGPTSQSKYHAGQVLRWFLKGHVLFCLRGADGHPRVVFGVSPGGERDQFNSGMLTILRSQGDILSERVRNKILVFFWEMIGTIDILPKIPGFSNVMKQLRMPVVLRLLSPETDREKNLKQDFIEVQRRFLMRPEHQREDSFHVKDYRRKLNKLSQSLAEAVYNRVSLACAAYLPGEEDPDEYFALNVLNWSKKVVRYFDRQPRNLHEVHGDLSVLHSIANRGTMSLEYRRIDDSPILYPKWAFRRKDQRMPILGDSPYEVLEKLGHVVLEDNYRDWVTGLIVQSSPTVTGRSKRRMTVSYFNR